MTGNSRLMKLIIGMRAMLFIFAFAGAASAQTWIELSPTGAPPDPVYTTKSVFYDATNNRLIAFFPGNPPFNPNPPANGNEVWILTNANGMGGTPAWIKLLPTGAAPISNGGESVAYDAANNRLIVYGGCFANCSPALFQLFVLTNANGLGGPPVWTQSIVTNPQARVDTTSMYDSANNLMITFGGQLAFFGTDQNDTRIISNANGAASPSTWSTLSTAGTPPPIRSAHSAIYDQANNRMTIFAGHNLINSCCPYVISDYNDLWVLSNANGQSGTPTWSQMTPAGAPPSVRSSTAVVYDTANNRMVMFGGAQWNQAPQTTTPVGDLWELSHANGLGGAPTWTQLTQGGTPPGPRFTHSAAFDVANQRMIVLGGRDATDTPSNRVWVLVFNTPPTAICQNVTVAAGANCTANASINNGSFDADGDSITLSQSPPGPYPLGSTPVTLTVTDSKGASSACSATVTVVDNTPPTISGAAANPSSLLPPNHKMVDVTVGYNVADNCDGSPVCTLSVTSNEPTEGTGDGDTAPDWEVIDSHHVRLRAERSGNGNGRVYTITITCADGAGNTSTATVTVTVAHNR